MTRPDLKPCPFCGGTPEWFDGTVPASGGDTEQLYRVACRDRTCMARPSVHTVGESGYPRLTDVPNEQAHAHCVNGWNRRHAP